MFLGLRSSLGKIKFVFPFEIAQVFRLRFSDREICSRQAALTANAVLYAYQFFLCSKQCENSRILDSTFSITARLIEGRPLTVITVNLGHASPLFRSTWRAIQLHFYISCVSAQLVSVGLSATTDKYKIKDV